MSFVIKDRVQETTVTTGTGTVTTLGPTQQHQSFSAGIGSGNTTIYGLLSGNGVDWEVGVGTVTVSAGVTTLSRSTILGSSNSGVAISLVGTSLISCANPANQSALLDQLYGSTRGTLLVRGSALWQALALGAANTFLGTDGTDALWQKARYIVSCFPGSLVLTASQVLLLHRVSKGITFPANFGSALGHASQAGGAVNATASTVLNVDKAPTATPNTFSNIGTITIAAGSVTPTLATSGGTTQSYAQGDVLRIIGPGSADATFAGFYATLVAQET